MWSVQFHNWSVDLQLIYSFIKEQHSCDKDAEIKSWNKLDLYMFDQVLDNLGTGILKYAPLPQTILKRE